MFLAIIPAAWLWWALELWGLPDIGDPFDVAEFHAKAIPDDRNAFVLYRRAAALLRPLVLADGKRALPNDVDTQWSKEKPEVRKWAEANPDALALYREGADRTNALDVVSWPIEEFTRLDTLRPFQQLALLEASRLEDMGDMAGAWGWYRAYIRTAHHASTYAGLYRRIGSQAWLAELLSRLERWSADPRTSSADLRRALDDVVACEALVPSESYTLKAQYLLLEWRLDPQNARAGHMPPSWLMRLGSSGMGRWVAPFLSPEQIHSISWAWCSWRREPERSRRVLRLLTANRLAYYDLPPGRRPAADPNVVTCDVYTLGPDSPPNARILSPESLGRWLESTINPRLLINVVETLAVRIKEVANHRVLVLQLASQLYRRDHGTDPPSPEALVEPYLERLPKEYPDEAPVGVKSEAAMPSP
jgi:hypothetical protein